MSDEVEKERSEGRVAGKYGPSNVEVPAMIFRCRQHCLERDTLPDG